MASSIEEHSGGGMPSRTKIGRVENSKGRRKGKVFSLKDVTPSPRSAERAGVAVPPTPGCFAQRVRNRLKTKELNFAKVQKAQKSAEEFEKKGDTG